MAFVSGRIRRPEYSEQSIPSDHNIIVGRFKTNRASSIAHELKCRQLQTEGAAIEVQQSPWIVRVRALPGSSRALPTSQMAE